jgi:hypothetical protein
MPPADTAVKIAGALGLSVEYLITGKEYQRSTDISKYVRFRGILDDLLGLSDDVLNLMGALIRTAAEQEKRMRATLISLMLISASLESFYIKAECKTVRIMLELVQP